VTLLNPHVYLDTVMILGSVSTQWPAASLPLFACGAVLASTVWFYGLALLAARLSPWLARPLVQRLIDGLVGSIMWGIALLLVAQALTR
jgi:L-lysine exporter family protein LysE/ArgO